MYLTKEVLPKFKQWVSSMEVPIKDAVEAKKYAGYFLQNLVDVNKMGSRGAVYDLFESVYEYACMYKLINAGQINAKEAIHMDNMYLLSYAIVSVIEHDAFDLVKYDPITTWGMDIQKAGATKM